VDHTAQELIERHGVDPDSIESAVDLAADYERRIKFQAEVQDYVDMSISSTINLPSYGSDTGPDPVQFASTLARYAPRLRGLTCYPDGSRGGQPLTVMDYRDVVDKLGEEFEEGLEANDSCVGGICGL
jgi:ribonucleoside-diphosphate reductase alpha chain